MTLEQIKDYLQKYRITSPNQLSTHIEQLENNTRPNKTLIFELYNYLEDWKLNSLFVERQDVMEKLNNIIAEESVKKEIEERLALAEKFKKQTLDKLYFKNPNLISQEEYEQLSQATYTKTEDFLTSNYKVNPNLCSPQCFCS
jgi:hypothetical protein